MGERVRGRKGQEMRARRMKLHPLCAHCQKRGIVRATHIIDHIIPVAAGGKDVDENTQGLCRMCEAIKTAGEALGTEGAANHPHWLRPAIIPPVIVCGPPCSGKATYVNANAKDGDVIIELDAILALLRPGFRHWVDAVDGPLFDRAIRARNAMLGALSSPPGVAAWFIIGAPTRAEREWWARQIGGTVVLMDTPRGVCEGRAYNRGTPGAVEGIARWYREAMQPWSPGKKKRDRVAFGPDGYPVE